MKKLLITVTVIAILGILAAVRFFGYTKYQEVELDKNKLHAQIDKKSDIDTENNNQKQNIQEESSNSSDNETIVNRNNIFDYLLAEIDSNKIKF